jgi:translation initiation factor IF-3
VPEVRVINNDGEQLGVMATDKAIEIAEEQGLDLVEVSPTASPPVCRIVDYGKYKYEKNKRLRQSKKKQHTIHVKEIKLRPKTEEHDYQFKKKHAEEFLAKLFKVKFTVIFRGRELDHKDMGARILNRIKEDLAHVGVVERPAQFEGRLMTMYMAPLAAKVPQAKQSSGKEGQDAKA